MFMGAKEMCFLVIFVVVLLLIMVYLQVCDFFVGRYVVRVIGQKTRNTQARRVYVPGSRQRLPSTQGEPTIFVSPSNLPPPPKYEAMAPPSYDEVMGVHYPSFTPGQQPITQPLTHALAHGSSTDSPTNVTINVNNVPRTDTPAEAPPAVVTVTTEERRTSVSVRA